MQTLGYGPDNRLKIKVSTRNTPFYRDPAVILIDQLKEVYIDGELEMIDTTNWYPKVMRKDYTVGLNLTGNALDDRTRIFTRITPAVQWETITDTVIRRSTS
jgi:peptide/nickel transport system substrate-binding protein